MTDPGLPAGFDPCRLTGFQHVMLYLLFEEPLCGTDLYERLDAELDETFHRNRMYTNLDALREEGLVAAAETPGRTKRYRLTDRGEAWLRARRRWEFAVSTRRR